MFSVLWGNYESSKSVPEEKELNEPLPKPIEVKDGKYHCLLQNLAVGHLQELYIC